MRDVGVLQAGIRCKEVGESITPLELFSLRVQCQLPVEWLLCGKENLRLILERELEQIGQNESEVKKSCSVCPCLC